MIEQQEAQDLLEIEVLNKLVRDTSIAVLPKMLEMFCAELKRRYKEVEEAVAANSIEMLAESSHALKSCSGTFGAMPLHQVAKTVETIAREKNLPMSDFEDEIRQMLTLIQSTLEQYERFDINELQS